jgi:hypothetical protein
MIPGNYNVNIIKATKDKAGMGRFISDDVEYYIATETYKSE